MKPSKKTRHNMNKPSNINPPRWANRILHWYCPAVLLEEIEGDLLEAFEWNVLQKGIVMARLLFVVDVIRFFNPTTFQKAKKLQRTNYYHPINHLTMLKHHLVIAFRNLWRQRFTSTINIFGLTIGLAGCLLIGLFVYDEWQFDTYHPEGDQVFRIFTNRGGEGGGVSWAGTSPALGPTLKEEFPEVDQTLRLFRIRQKLLFKKEDQNFLEEKGIYAEPSIFDFFHLPLRYGNPETALIEPNTIVLSTPLAKKYFGDEDPVGKTIQIGSDEAKVTGVLENLSPHFHLNFNFLVSFEGLIDAVPEERIKSWLWQDFMNYIKVYPDTDLERFSAKLPAFVEHHAHPQTKERGFYYYLQLQPLKDVHLHSASLYNDFAVRGNYRYVNGLAFVGLFLLIIACINFINLTTAKAVRRAKEVGIRKTAGALRSQLAMQFISEAILIVSIAMLVAIQLTNLLLPYLNDFTSKSLVFPIVSSSLLLTSVISLTLITGLLAGLYPAFVLSGFRPSVALKGGQSQSGGHIKWLRQGLVVVQFTLSILLIIGASVIFKQLNFLQYSDLGFQRDQLLHFPMKGKLFQNFETSKAAFLKVPGVTAATTGYGIPGDIVSGDDIIVPGPDRKILPARIFNIDHEYVSTMGMEIVAGRDFSKEISTDATEGFIINETAVQNLGLGNTPEEAIDQPLEWQMWTDHDTIKKGRVIGVVRDFHYASLHEEVQTAVLQVYPDSYWKMALRINTDDVSGTIAAIEETWDRFETGYPLDYQFVDASFGAMYKEEQKLGDLLGIFTILAIFIACIGAFGLVTYATEQRRKEIGIRKVLGASVAAIVQLLSKEFLLLVFLALVIASPIAWYAMQQWLADFAYSIKMDWWVFVLSGIGAILIAGLTVGFQSIRAALANPVEALRDE